MRVPRVSKKSTNKNASTTIIKLMKPPCTENASLKPLVNVINVGAIDCGADTMPLGITEYSPSSGAGTYKPVSSNMIPIIQVSKIPIKILPKTFLYISIVVIMTPMMQRSAAQV